MTTTRLTSIRDKITKYYKNNNIKVNLNPEPIFKIISSHYLKDIQDLTGGNDNTYKKFYKKNEKYFFNNILYFI